MKQYELLLFYYQCVVRSFLLYYFKTRKIAPDGQYYHIKGFFWTKFGNVNGALAEQNLDETKPPYQLEDK